MRGRDEDRRPDRRRDRAGDRRAPSPAAAPDRLDARLRRVRARLGTRRPAAALGQRRRGARRPHAGDRLDANHHPARGELGWHDAAARLEGPVVADVAEHFALRWREVTGEALAAPALGPAAAGGLDVQLVRTVPERIYDALPRGDFRILESYVGALRGAERLVYLESQFLWSPEIVAILAEKLRDPPPDGFR